MKFIIRIIISKASIIVCCLWIAVLIGFNHIPCQAVVSDPLEVNQAVSQLKKNSPKKKVMALRKLGEMGQAAAPAVPLIIELLDSNQKYETIWDKVINTIMILGTSGTYIKDEARQTLVKIGKPSLQPLYMALGQARLKLRIQAAITLGEIHDPSAAAPLVLALQKDYSWQVRMWSAQAIGEISKFMPFKDLQNAALPLITALNDKNIHVCQKASYSLGQMKSKAAIPDLITTLQNRGKNSGADLALFMITGQRLGDDVGKWKNWWDQHQNQSL